MVSQLRNVCVCHCPRELHNDRGMCQRPSCLCNQFVPLAQYWKYNQRVNRFMNPYGVIIPARGESVWEPKR